MNFGIPLVTINQLAEIDELSNKPRINGVLIFKHSTRCSVSFFALKHLISEWNFHETEVPVYFLDLLSYRAISNQIAVHYGVEHESPQILLIKKGKCVGNASHNFVSVNTVQGWLNG